MIVVKILSTLCWLFSLNRIKAEEKARQKQRKEALQIQCPPFVCTRIVSKRCVRQFTLRFARVIGIQFSSSLLSCQGLSPLPFDADDRSFAPSIFGTLSYLYIDYTFCLFLRSIWVRVCVCAHVNSLWENAFKSNTLFSYIFILSRLFALILSANNFRASPSLVPPLTSSACVSKEPSLSYF